MGTLVRGLLLGLVIISPLKSKGEVNPQEGSYERTDLDPLSKNLTLSRTYSSRSLHLGLFGLGWCSELDQKLIRRGNSFEVHYCDLPPAKVSSPTPPGHEISYQLGTRKYTFSYSGRLMSIQLSKNRKMDLLYDREGFLKELQTGPPHESISVRVDRRSGRVLSLKSSTKRALETQYRYEGFSLVQVVQGAQDKWKYLYDETANLIQAIDREGRLSQMKYDSGKDWIRWVKDAKGCETFVRYEGISGALGHTTILETQCGGKWTQRERKSFYLKEMGNGGAYVTNVTTEEVGSDQE